ncbi:MAG: hypothetical protein KGJ07_05120 [Patescibacteria group bacterium]|nr:hypothetical protein [Patescibacteria group bacterium]MDE2588715.1 hypothetical protein [Patescibacteria group bacterium]
MSSAEVRPSLAPGAPNEPRFTPWSFKQYGLEIQVTYSQTERTYLKGQKAVVIPAGVGVGIVDFMPGDNGELGPRYGMVGFEPEHKTFALVNLLRGMEAFLQEMERMQEAGEDFIKPEYFIPKTRTNYHMAKFAIGLGFMSNDTLNPFAADNELVGRFEDIERAYHELTSHKGKIEDRLRKNTDNEIPTE